MLSARGALVPHRLHTDEWWGKDGEFEGLLVVAAQAAQQQDWLRQPSR